MKIKLTLFIITKIAIPVILLLNYSSLEAQTVIIDSLKVKFARTDKINTGKVCNQIALQYLDINTDSARKYATLAYDNASQLAQVKDQAQALFCLGYCWEMDNNFFEALENYQHSISLYQIINDKYGVASLATYIGSIYKFTGHFETALRYYFLSLKLYSSIDDLTGVSYSLNNIGVVHFNAGNYKKARDYYRKSLKYSILLRDSISIASTLNNMGLISFQLEEYVEAENLFRQALDICREMNDPSGMATAYSNIADVLIHYKKYDEALNYLDLVEAIAPRAFGASIRVSSLLNQADIYSKIHNSQLAEENFRKAIEQAAKYNLRPALADSYYQYSIFLIGQNRKPEAADLLVKYIALNDSIHTEELSEQLANSDFNIELREQKLRNTMLREQQELNELRTQNWQIVSFIVILTALVFMVFVIIFYSKLKSSMKQKKALVKQNAEINDLNVQLRDLHREHDSLLTDLALELDDEKLRRLGIEKTLAFYKEEKQKREARKKVRKTAFRFIVVSDDDPINTLLLIKSIEYLGPVTVMSKLHWESIPDTTGFSAPDVVFIDVPTDLIQQFGVGCKRLKYLFPETKFIAMSAYLLNSDRDFLLNSGYDYCLTKPLSSEAMARCCEFIDPQKRD